MVRRFTCYQPRTWAFFYVDDELWVLSVVSDHGNFAYRWHRNDNESFVDFLKSAEVAYIWDKLTCECPERRYEVDVVASKRALRARVCAARRRRDLNRHRARELWEEIDDFFASDMNVEDMGGRLYEFLDYEPPFTERMTSVAEVFVGTLLPAFKEALNAQS